MNPPTLRKTRENEECKQNEEINDRLHNNNLNKIKLSHDDTDYYNKYKVKPGFYFYKALVSNKYPISRLKVNIPETILGLDS